MKKLLFALIVVAGGVCLPFASTRASADTTPLSPHSWDPGLYATTGPANDTVHAWGQRSTPGAWGTGPVNYQSGATAISRASSSGTLSVVMSGTYCPGGQCSYGGGTGYKGLIQFWNDPTDFIAFGLIHDPGVSPNGMTIMVEGAGHGKPVGGYWPAGAISGASHLFSFTWNASGISMTIDNQATLGPYSVAEDNPSISFLAAGRLTGDIADTTFTGITTSSTPSTPGPGPSACYPLTNSGNCYEPGEYCRISDHGAFGIAGDGESIECVDNNGWRWEPV